MGPTQSEAHAVTEHARRVPGELHGPGFCQLRSRRGRSARRSTRTGAEPIESRRGGANRRRAGVQLGSLSHERGRDAREGEQSNVDHEQGHEKLDQAEPRSEPRPHSADFADPPGLVHAREATRAAPDAVIARLRCQSKSRRARARSGQEHRAANAYFLRTSISTLLTPEPFNFPKILASVWDIVPSYVTSPMIPLRTRSRWSVG